MLLNILSEKHQLNSNQQSRKKIKTLENITKGKEQNRKHRYALYKIIWPPNQYFEYCTQSWYSAIRNRMQQYGKGSKKGNKDDHRSRMAPVKRMTEYSKTLQPRKDRRQEISEKNLKRHIKSYWYKEGKQVVIGSSNQSIRWHQKKSATTRFKNRNQVVLAQVVKVWVSKTETWARWIIGLTVPVFLIPGDESLHDITHKSQITIKTLKNG